MIKSLFGGFRDSENETEELAYTTTSKCGLCGSEMKNHFAEREGELFLKSQKCKECGK